MDIASRRTTNPYADALSTRAAAVALTPGTSSYFTAPEQSLDPALFDGQRMKPAVRRGLLSTLLGYVTQLGYHHPDRWLTAWLAGSGASYQWAAARDPGDLDILLGIDHTVFYELHPGFQGVPADDVDNHITEQLKAGLWPATAHQRINGHVYEVTWYVNPGSSDIRSIVPYAAYDLNTDEWTVPPIELPADGPTSWFPQSWQDAAAADEAHAKDVLARYENARNELAATANGPRQVNVATQLKHIVAEGAQLFDDIHLGRHEAFKVGGDGYRDWANFRWQAGKRSGVVPALHALKSMQAESELETERRLYGAELADAQHTLTAAGLQGKRI